MQTTETAGGQKALKKCTAGCLIFRNGKMYDRREGYIV